MPTAIPKSSVTPYEPHHVQMWFQNPVVATEGAWVTIPNLRCRGMRQAAQPYGGISSAELTYDYGRLDLDDGSGWQTILPLGEVGSLTDTLNPYAGAPVDAVHRMIRVNILNGTTGLIEARWAGVATAFANRDFKQPNSPATDSDTVTDYGTQEITVSGPEWILNRRQITQSFVAFGKLVDRALPFNIRSSRPGLSSANQFGNRDKALKLFTPDLSEATPWTGEDIALYLADSFFPRAIDAALPWRSPILNWFVSNAQVLKPIVPQLVVEGKTTYQLLNELADPKRFLNWAVKYSPGATDSQFGRFDLMFSTASAAPIVLPHGAIIPANLRQVALNASGTIDGHISLSRDASNDYQKVIVTGARRGHVLTQQIEQDDLLKKDWTDAEETEYNDGLAGVDPDWGNYDHNEKEVRNRAFRKEQLPHVYTRFACPELTDLSDFTPRGAYVPGLRWKRQTPLKENWDYTVNPPVAKASAKPQPETLAQFAVYKWTSLTGEHWATHPNLSAAMRDDGISPEAVSSVSLRPLEDAFGIELTPSRRQPHWQAKAESVTDPDGSEDQQFDYASDIYFTGYFQEDARVTGEWPKGNVTDNNAGTLIIRLGDVALHDTLHKNTIVGVENSQLIRSPNKDVVLQDDSEDLEDIARLAFEWYGTQRYAYQLGYAQILRDVDPGMIAVNIDGTASDSLVTEVVYDFDNRQTSIATAYAQPDFTLLAKQVLSS